MAVTGLRIERQAEPIPGYRLLERIGGGSFGEVWKAEAPGGILKAIKFVYGTLESSEDDGQRVHQELKAINRVKTVRHPYILSLERYDIVAGQLVIVMELADYNLWDRFKEYRAKGQPGIPRDELLRYMEETAEALDMMHTEFQLQHLDIKPQNLFLVHNHVKVGDFGLVKDLQGMRSQLGSGVTPIYAAPEIFDGIVSRHCDQYNLAIVYQELLTGHRPFGGTTVRQLLFNHLTGTPEVSYLPMTDRPVILRPLARDPEERFPSCRDLVRALRGEEPETIVLKAHPESSSNSANAPALLDSSSGSNAGPIAAPARDEGPELVGDGILFPSLVVSIGGLGLRVLQHLRHNLDERWGTLSVLPHLRMLHIDADPDAVAQLGKAKKTTPALDDRGVLLARLNRPGHYLKPVRGQRPYERWLDVNLLCHVPRDQVAPAGMRALGRLAFVENHAEINARLKAELEACLGAEVLTTADEQTGLGVRTKRPRIYVVAGLAGGTASGMFLDVAYALRRLLKQRGYARSEVVGLFLVPPANPGTDRLALGNCYAALTELYTFAAPDGIPFSAQYSTQEGAVYNPEPPFQRCILLPLGPSVAGSAAGGTPGESQVPTVTLAGDFLYRDLTTPLGRVADDCRGSVAASAEIVTIPTRNQRPVVEQQQTAALMLQTLGAARFHMPRRALVRMIAHRLCRQMVQSWLTADAGPVHGALQSWSETHLSQWDLSPEALARPLREACAAAIGQAPETLFDSAVERFAVPAAQEKRIDAGLALEALAEIERQLGRPERAGQMAPTHLQQAAEAGAQTLVADLTRRAGLLVISLLEDPRFRLAGAGELTQRFLTAAREGASRSMATEKQLARQAEESHKRAHTHIFSLQRSALWVFQSKSKVATDLAQALRLYARLRYEEIIAHRLRVIYDHLVDTLPQRHKDLQYCRERLNELARLFETGTPEPADAAQIAIRSREVFPYDCSTFTAAIDHLITSVSAEDFLLLQRRTQEAMERQFDSLASACVTFTTSGKDWRELLLREAERFVELRLEGTTVANVYLARPAGEDALVQEIAAAFAEAAPQLLPECPTSARVLAIVASPDDSAGQQFRALASRALTNVGFLSTTSPDDLVIQREQSHLTFADLPQLGPEAQKAYEQATQDHVTLHSRCDVREWSRISGQ